MTHNYFPSYGVLFRVVEDFRDWTNWLLYRGGIGVKGEESWEAWWEEELVISTDISKVVYSNLYRKADLQH